MKSTLRKLMAVNLFAMLFVLLFSMLCVSASAQNGFDYFAIPRTVVLLSPAKLAAGTTNAAVDIRHFTGTARIDIFSTTNAPALEIDAVPLVSDDATNWSFLLNYALSTPAAVIYTNTVYGSSLKVTNNYLLPGAITTPTAATAGFATPYLLANQFTNSGAFAITNGVYSIGFQVEDTKRYLAIGIYGATCTNWSGGATLVGRANNVP